MRKSLLIAAFLLVAGAAMCFGQNESIIKGQIIQRQNGEPAGFATVAVLHPDSTVVAGTMAAEDGHFEIKAGGGHIILSVSLIGYKDVLMNLTLSGQAVNVGRIALEEDLHVLEGAIIQAQLPHTELKGDAVVTNIAGSVLEHSGNAQDLIGKIPGMIQRDGKPEVLGKGEPVFYINGRRVLDNDELRSLMSEEIRSIEVVNNPGASYDSEIKAVVRVKTVRRQGEGFSFALTSQAQKYLTTKDFDPSWSVLDLNYRKGSVDFIGKLVYWDNHGYQYADIFESLYSGGRTYGQYGELAVRQHAGGTNALIGVNWQISENHSVGMQIRNDDLLFGNYKETVDEDVIKDEIIIDRLTSVNEANMLGDDVWSGNIYYSGKLEELEIEFNTDFQSDSESTENSIAEASRIEPRFINSRVDNSSGILASKLVFRHPLWKGQIQAGAEESYVRAWQKHMITFDQIAPSEAEIKENNIAGFAEYFLPLEFGQFGAGIRYEHVSYLYNDIAGSDNLKRKQNNWFPSASFSTKIGKVALSASISGKTQRPSFWQLSNEMQYHSRFTYQTGSPTLKNEKYVDAAINANWKWLTLSATYENIKDAIGQLGHPYNDEGITVMNYENLKNPINIYSAYIVAAPVIGCWNPQYTAGFRKQFLTMDVVDGRVPSGHRSVEYNTPLFTLQLNNYFRFKGDWQISADYRFNSGMSYGAAEIIYPTNVLDFSIQKSFLKDKSLTVMLSATDVLDGSREHVRIDYGNFLVDQTSDHKRPAVILRVSYHLNSTMSKYKGSGAGESVKNRL